MLTRILFISWNRVLYDVNRPSLAEICHDFSFGFKSGHIRLHFVLVTIIASILGLILQAMPAGAPSPLYAQFMTPLTPALRGFPPSSMFSNEGVIPMCSDISISYIPVSSIGMVNCPPSTIPVVMITSPLTFSSTSSNLISLCTYRINSEFDFFGLGLTPTVTLTDCIFLSSQLPPLAADTIVSPARANFPSVVIPSALFP
jgi:hypothetical protein